jgi:hypothetical protein
MGILRNDHFTLENPSIGVKHFTTNLDVSLNTNPTDTSHCHQITGMAIKMLVYLPTLAFSMEARWSNKPR